MKRGDVYWAILDPRSGSEQRGRRPVMVVSHDSFNSVVTWRSVIVIPFSTSETQRRRGPTAIAIPAGAAGLTSDCVALCHQVTTLDRSKLAERVGKVDLDLLRLIEEGLKSAMDLP